MKQTEEEYLYELVQNPPPGSKIEAAVNFGVDLTLNLRALRLTPTERVQEMQRALAFVKELRAAMIRTEVNLQD